VTIVSDRNSDLPARHAERDGYVAITLRVMSPQLRNLFEVPLSELFGNCRWAL
jgi:hypothetical protein